MGGTKPEGLRIEQFLTGFANLPGDPFDDIAAIVNQTDNPFDAPADRLLEKFPEFLPLSCKQADKRKLLHTFTPYLRTAWRSPDPRERQWYLHALRREFTKHVYGKADAWKLPPLSPFEYAMLHLENERPRVRFCANPACEHPYYISKTTKASKYCSVECANSGVRKSKLNYYHLNRAKKGA